MATQRERERRESRRTNARDWAKQQKAGGATCWKLPEGYEQYKLETSLQKLDFMPYIAGSHNPRADEGYEHFELEYDEHWIPGLDGKNRPHVCSVKSFGKKCAVCDFLSSHRDLDKKVSDQLRASTRHLWLVNDKPGSEKVKPKILQTNHYNKQRGFGEQIVTAINSNDDYADFADLSHGYTLSITAVEETFPGGKYTVVTRIDFVKRKYEYPTSYLEKCPCLDECLIEPDYDALMALLEGRPGTKAEPSKNGDTEDDDEPKGRSRGKASDDEHPEADDDDDDEDSALEEPTAKSLGLKVGQLVQVRKLGECEIMRISPDGTSLTVEDEDGKEHKAIAPGDCKKAAAAKDEEEDDDEDDEEEAPVKGKKRKPPVDEDDDEDDDEPPTKTRKGARAKKPADDEDDD